MKFSPSNAVETAVRFWTHAPQAIAKRLPYRDGYATSAQWLLSFYDVLLRFDKGRRWPYARTVLPIHLRGIDQPFYVRLGEADWFVLEEVFLQKDYDMALRAELGTIKQIVDIGSNVGITLRRWRMLWPEAHIIGVEPETGNYELLLRNTDGGKDIALAKACVTNESKPVFINTTGYACAYKMDSDDAPGRERVEGLTVPDLLKAHGVGSTIDLLKCDIEGAEQQLFATCADWIRDVRAMVIEVHPPYTEQMLLDDLERNGARFKVRSRSHENLLMLTQPARAS